jgi:hypothetical protein
MTDVKAKILAANECLKSIAILFSEIYPGMPIAVDPALIENTNLALGELMKCIKHLALSQGDITGKELMPPEIFEPTKTVASNDQQETVN